MPRLDGIRAVARTERRKLAAQLPLRILVVLAVLGPVAFTVLLKVQSSTPSDALFGVWVHTSGFAGSLVVLSFAANWGFPLIAGVLAGDVFAAEDRHRTWKTVLTRSRSLDELFAGKAVAAAAWVCAVGLLLAAASVLTSVVLVGAHPTVDLSGQLRSPAALLVLTVLSWLIALLPLLAYAALAILVSVAFRSGIVGVCAPLVVSLLSQLLALLGNGVWIHLLLIGSAFDGWHGLFVAHPFFGPLLVTAAVSIVWTAALLAATLAILRRREFVPEADRRRGDAWRVPVRLAVGGVAVVGLLAVGTTLGPAGDTAPRLTGAITPEFHRLVELQQHELGHPIPNGAVYRIVPVCRRRAAKPIGPGDWSCVMNVYILLPGGGQPLTDTPVAYDVSLQSNGCFKASSPPLLVGQATIRERPGTTVVNPIVTFYGCFNVL